MVEVARAGVARRRGRMRVTQQCFTMRLCRHHGLCPRTGLRLAAHEVQVRCRSDSFSRACARVRVCVRLSVRALCIVVLVRAGPREAGLGERIAALQEATEITTKRIEMERRKKCVRNLTRSHVACHPHPRA